MNESIPLTIRLILGNMDAENDNADLLVRVTHTKVQYLCGICVAYSARLYG
jgi:hypothetical protein